MKLFKNSDKKTVSSGLAISFGAALMLFAVLNFGLILGWLGTLFSYVSSVIWGLAIAYLMRPFTKFVSRSLPKRIKSEGTRDRIAAACALVLLLVVIVLAFVIIIPRAAASIKDFITNFDSYLESLKTTIKQVAGSLKFIEVSEESIDEFIGSSETVIRSLMEWLESNYERVITIVTSVAGVIVDIIIIISLTAYALFDMRNIKRNFMRVELALIGREKSERFNRVLTRGDRLMTGFLSSNIIDALIIGVINFIFLTIVDAPYTLILSVILGVTNFVPTFGPIIGGVIGAVIIVLTDSPLLLPFIIFTLVLQQIDGNVLKPLLFGDSTGLSGFWVLVAIVVGGNMFGILGMILGVPVCAFVGVILDETLSRLNGDDDIRQEKQHKRKLSFGSLFKKRSGRQKKQQE